MGGKKPFNARSSNFPVDKELSCPIQPFFLVDHNKIFANSVEHGYTISRKSTILKKNPFSEIRWRQIH